MTEQLEADGGRLAAEALRRHDVDTLFTLSGGHLFPLYDGCVQTGIRLVDTRHEQTATFAAEGWAKVTRRSGVAALTAGPGVTNGVSAITSASLNGTPMLVIGGRAPQARWGGGSLQELDHVPIVASITKVARTAASPEQIPELVDAALRAACTPHRGPAFVDVPLDAWGTGSATLPDPPRPGELAGAAPDGDAIAAVAKLVDEADRPVLMVGADVFWARGEDALRAFAEAARLPVFANGLGRGLLPADHELAFSRVRGAAFAEADLVVVAGAPLDFRLGFGRFGDARVVHLADSTAGVARSVDLAAGAAGDLAQMLAALAGATRVSPSSRERVAWVARLRAEEDARRAREADDLDADASPIRPTRVYGELRRRLDRDAIVIGDGGDFVSYAGKYVDTYRPGGFIDPGPYGCLGTGCGYALAAALAHPGRQVVVMWGDGALGFSLGDLDTLVRFGADVVGIVGNNGIWGLEKHPMRLIYGYDVVAELRPGTRYDEVMTALGGHGELVAEPGAIGPALDRAFATPGPSLVNVLTDPEDVYPRSSNLA
ncbi:MAG TPA: acetolactate synthase [Acidimicrobiia bacterium]|nr:acetolactate synthase [Acidimicrobiia bacterium]